MVLQDRYRIIHKIGDGGMGAVYEGVHTVIKRRVAIKILHPQFAKNPEITARFQREAEAATSIGHPNICEATDMGNLPDGSAYMVLEFLEGRDWSDDIAKQGAQPLGKVVHILTQVCNALEVAHKKGIVHRDLKPENIFLIERSGDPNFAKVVDFGISKIMDGPEGGGHSLTQTGTALGTPYYMAPEQCQGKKDIDYRADIYALGIIFFQALTAQYPFDDESYPMLVLKICTEQPPLLSTFRPDLPAELQNILHRMLAKNREHRYATMAEVRAALAPYAGRNEAPVVTANAPSTAARGPSVLHGVSTPTGSSPTGTAYLPSSPAMPAGPTPYPLKVPGSSNRGLIAAAAVMFGLVILVGGGVGAYVAMNGGDGEVAETPSVGSGPDAPEDAPTDLTDPEPTDPTEVAANAAADPAQPPSVVQPGGATVLVSLRVPEGVSVSVDGVNYPLSTEEGAQDVAIYFGPMPRRASGHIVASGEGYEDYESEESFLERRQLNLVPLMRRVSGSTRGRRGTRPGASDPAAADNTTAADTTAADNTAADATAAAGNTQTPDDDASSGGATAGRRGHRTGTRGGGRATIGPRPLQGSGSTTRGETTRGGDIFGSGSRPRTRGETVTPGSIFH